MEMVRVKKNDKFEEARRIQFPKYSMKVIYLLFFLCIACNSNPISTIQTNNKEIKYEVLFTRHGCEIGRIREWTDVYITLCPGGNSASFSEYQTSCGKNCVQTIRTDHKQHTSDMNF